MKLKLNEIKKEIYNGKHYVHDLTVKDNHSYCVSENNYIVHNCLTTQNIGLGYGMGSLIKECHKIKMKYDMKNKTNIVADGGFKKYSDVIKALGLGANYVMLGSIFNKALESCAKTYRDDNTVVNQYSDEAKQMLDADIPLYKKYRGMSTKEVQKEWGKVKLTTSEGIHKENKVEYRLDKWVENFSDYLKSAMSYTNKKTLPEFIGNVNFNLISDNVLKRFTK